MKLDHLVWVSNSLGTAVAEFEWLSGVRAGTGGRHLSIGSRNALADLGNECYLAIDGPDPEQNLVGNYGAFLVGLASPMLWRFAVQTPDLAAAREILVGHGLETVVKPGSRTTTGGELLEWDTLSVSSLDLGLGMPIIKTWRTDLHPSSGAPHGCRLLSLTVSHPKAAFLRVLYDELEIAVETREASAMSLMAEIEGPKGRFRLPVM